jgi:hypothetical protein
LFHHKASFPVPSAVSQSAWNRSITLILSNQLNATELESLRNKIGSSAVHFSLGVIEATSAWHFRLIRSANLVHLGLEALSRIGRLFRYWRHGTARLLADQPSDRQTTRSVYRPASRPAGRPASPFWHWRPESVCAPRSRCSWRPLSLPLVSRWLAIVHSCS